MDVTAAKEMQEQQEPFYEIDIATADEKQDAQPFYNMDDNPTNVYADLDPEFVSAEDEVCRRHRAKEPEENQENAHQDGTSCSQPCRVFLRSRPACITAVCVGVVISVIAATVLTLMFNHHSVMSSQPEDSTMVSQTTLSANLTTWSPPLPVTSLATSSSQIPVTSLPASPETTLGKDWQTEWILFIRGYFQQDNQTALALEERYPDNDVVLSLLADNYFWPWVCRFWNHFWELPCTLTRLVTYCIDFGTKSDYNYMESHAISTYNEFFSTVLDALEALSNITKSTNSAAEYISAISLSLTRRPLSNNDVEALVKLFPYLEGTDDLHLSSCRISSGAATILSKRLHFLANLEILNLQNNNIGDDGVRAIAEKFTELKNLRMLNFAGNSITMEGGKAMAENLVHLQDLRTIYFRNNEVALSLHPLAKAFVNMSTLELVYMWPVTYRRGSFDMVVEQVRNAVHTLGGKVYSSTKSLLYDGSHAIRVGSPGLDTAWQRVKRELNVGVHIYESRGQLKVSVKIRPI
ncbi:uncharacterized protein [Branchiostoma lanceolatum]|uniref:uncharacterized protein n=1 Tax=Branchiostoma lanceolatum TaxID=7740 RepID=UPI003453E9D8